MLSKNNAAELAGLDCLYCAELHEGESGFQLRDEEFRHLRALRLREDEKIAVTNGKGLLALCRVREIGKNSAVLEAGELFPDYGELPRRLGLALGVLENKDRFEFALEKCTELGISDFYPLLADFSQRKNISAERLESKAIAAIKQCKRARLPLIHPPLKISSLLEERSFTTLILADYDGVNPVRVTKDIGPALIIAGPEGGLSDAEIRAVRSDTRTVAWTLGERRLRAETAAIMATGIASLHF